MSRQTGSWKKSQLAGLGFILLFLSEILVSCVTIPAPIEEYTLARAAIDSAKSVDAARYSPGYFHKAEVNYRTGQLDFDDREYENAILEFIQAREYAEKAENSSRLIRFKNGEVL